MITLPSCEPFAAYADITREQWLALRRTGIGGSEAGAVMGLSEYGSPLTVVLDKTGRLPISNEESEFATVGNILEPIIRRELVGQYIAEKMKLAVAVLDPTHMYRSREWPWMLCNPDGFLHIPTMYEHTFEGLEEDEIRLAEKARDIGLEIKTGSSYQLKHWGGRGGDEVPDSYYCQVQHYMAVTGLSEWWIFGLIGNQRLLRIVPRNEEFIAALVEEERKIWEIVEANDPLLFPLPNGSDADMEALLQVGTPQTSGVLVMTGYEGDIDAYKALSEEAKRIDAERARIKQRLIQAMGRSKYGQAGRWDLNMIRYQVPTFDRGKLKKDHPDIAEQYTSHTEAGRLNIKERKEETK